LLAPRAPTLNTTDPQSASPARRRSQHRPLDRRVATRARSTPS